MRHKKRIAKETAALLLAAIVFVLMIALPGCGNDDSGPLNPCGSTDQSYCQSDSVVLKCLDFSGDWEWTEILCDEICSHGEGVCVEDEYGAHCECQEPKPQAGDPCNRGADPDFCKDDLVLMTCWENSIGEQMWIEIECTCVPQGDSRCEEDHYGTSCRC